MNAIKDLFNSERGFLAVLLIIAITVLAAIGVATFQQWNDFALFVFVTYTGAKTITGVTSMVTTRPQAPPATTTHGADVSVSTTVTGAA